MPQRRVTAGGGLHVLVELCGLAALADVAVLSRWLVAPVAEVRPRIKRPPVSLYCLVIGMFVPLVAGAR